MQASITQYSDCTKLKKICADTDGNKAINAIQSLQRDLDGLKSQSTDLKNLGTTNIQNDLIKASQFSASLQTINKILQENISIINKLQAS